MFYVSSFIFRFILSLIEELTTLRNEQNEEILSLSQRGLYDYYYFIFDRFSFYFLFLITYIQMDRDIYYNDHGKE